VASSRARERRRRRYRPEELRVLFIGESPPAGPMFFYDGDSILYQATRDAFIAAYPRLVGVEFLPAFQRMGCYLEDLSQTPINDLPRRERREAQRAAVPQLTRRIAGSRPRTAVVVVKGIRDDVARALRAAGLADVPIEALPFPSQWHRSDYVSELSELVRQWRRRKVLLPPFGRSGGNEATRPRRN
jgi:hypothetical protein